MRRIATFLLLPWLALAPAERGWAQLPAAGRSATAIEEQQGRLEADLRDLETPLRQGRLTSAEAVSGSERLRARYFALRPLSRTFGAGDYRRHGPLAGRAFAWLDGARRQFRGDPLVTRSLLGTYAALGDFYGQEGLVSRAGFWFGYAGAHRAGRLLLLAGQEGGAFERTLESLALTWAAVAAMTASPARWLPSDWGAAAPGFDRVIDQAVGLEPAPEPVALPALDEVALTAGDQVRWREVRNRFPGVSSRAHQARLAVADLRSRLAQRGMELHSTSVAASLAMQGYLQDAVDAIEARDFDRALEALTRAEYQRTRLRDVTGQ